MSAVAKVTLQQQVVNSITAIAGLYQLDTSLVNEIIDSFSQNKLSAFRVNTIKTTVKDVLIMLAEASIPVSPVNWSSLAYLVEDKLELSQLALVSEGHVYIQNLSSQLTVYALNPKPDSFILDLAAAPGGKTSYIAAIMENKGKVSAVEPVKDRYYRMIANLRNLGVTNTRCYQKDGRVVGKLCHEWFDQVLLDAPCSSMAQIDLRDPDSYAHWNLKKVRECSRKQKQLICSAFDSLKPGGEMIYSTCSWMIEENEAVVNHLLEYYPDQVQIIDLELPVNNYLPGVTAYLKDSYSADLAKTVRIIPDCQFEAFYIAKIRKVM